MPVSTDQFTKASESLNRLAKALKGEGRLTDSERYLQLAAEIELSSADLQRCWGGPFNGQEERIAIMTDLLRDLQPECFVETGCFRGLSTSWIAENYKGPIYTCEIERLYAIQAIHNTRKHENVNVIVDDSRSFLKNVLGNDQSAGNILFYLDAHWEHDLPLAEELDTIFKLRPNSVIVIDDFMVPDDLSYGWDDYGEGKSLDVRMLVGHTPEDAVIYFPRLKGDEETGSKRGCCVIASSSRARRVTSSRLRGAPLKDWLTRMDSTSVQRSQLRDQQGERSTETANMSYPELVRVLRDENIQLVAHIEAIERDRAQRLSDVITLSDQLQRKDAQMEVIEKDRAKRLEDILALTDVIKQMRAIADGNGPH
ncbi:class I SAM-dependent methyltransferase [Methylobacterium brachiatum]|uniref:class I SAM-dependent methyltransferase n=1 Tax=Methylobacterium brachiatum TaxID=269660 RepID=UPI0008EE9192|nr:class I SAM-dependent methyltransferase [Methylobacterium brachiatum]SFI15932.1 Predicted O-methyltransferase YrrM [Methylobacterium brachiatum]